MTEQNNPRCENARIVYGEDDEILDLEWCTNPATFIRHGINTSRKSLYCDDCTDNLIRKARDEGYPINIEGMRKRS